MEVFGGKFRVWQDFNLTITIQTRLVWSHLVNIYITEMYEMDRVKLQFGFQQQMSSLLRCLREYYEMTMIKSQKHKNVELNKYEKCEWKRRFHLVFKDTILDGDIKLGL